MFGIIFQLCSYDFQKKKKKKTMGCLVRLFLKIFFKKSLSAFFLLLFFFYFYFFYLYVQCLQHSSVSDPDRSFRLLQSTW